MDSTQLDKSVGLQVIQKPPTAAQNALSTWRGANSKQLSHRLPEQARLSDRAQPAEQGWKRPKAKEINSPVPTQKTSTTTSCQQEGGPSSSVPPLRRIAASLLQRGADRICASWGEMMRGSKSTRTLAGSNDSNFVVVGCGEVRLLHLR
ncbi:unnamed protein product [Boreogadus saida]